MAKKKKKQRKKTVVKKKKTAKKKTLKKRKPAKKAKKKVVKKAWTPYRRTFGKPKKQIPYVKKTKKAKKKARKTPRAPKALPKRLSPEELVIGEIAGMDVLRLVRALKNKKNVSEFKLADAVDEEINTIRNMLYRLYDANLVTFIRKKDKKKGWYIYYWTFNQGRVKDLAKALKINKIEKLKERLEREKSTSFFTCDNKCIRLDFEQAVEFEYKCPECGVILEQEDNSKRIIELEKEIKKLEKELTKSKGKLC